MCWRIVTGDGKRPRGESFGVTGASRKTDAVVPGGIIKDWGGAIRRTFLSLFSRPPAGSLQVAGHEERAPLHAYLVAAAHVGQAPVDPRLVLQQSRGWLGGHCVVDGQHHVGGGDGPLPSRASRKRRGLLLNWLRSSCGAC